MPFNLGFIGGGKMSSAIAKGILNKGAHPASNIWVSGPRLDSLKHWVELGTNVTIRNGEVFSNCDIIFLGVKPDKLSDAIEGCLNTLTSHNPSREVLIVSMLAGVTIRDLQKALSVLPGIIHVIRIMPNTPMTVGAGACLYTPDSTVSSAQSLIVEKLLSNCGICERVPESLVDSLGALVGCGPAYIYIVIEALADGAVKQGVPREIAQRMAAQMVAGSGQMVLKSGKHPGLLKDEVCSPGGSTICGIAALEDGKIRSAFIRAVQESTLKSKELGKK